MNLLSSLTLISSNMLLAADVSAKAPRLLSGLESNAPVFLLINPLLLCSLVCGADGHGRGCTVINEFAVVKCTFFSCGNLFWLAALFFGYTL